MHEERVEMYFENDPKLLPGDTPLQKYVNKLRSTSSCQLGANVEDFMKEIELLENYYPSNDESQCFGRKISPLIDFLTICGPAVDMMIQGYPAPSALIWNSTKVLLEVSTFSCFLGACAKWPSDWTYLDSLLSIGFEYRIENH